MMLVCLSHFTEVYSKSSGAILRWCLLLYHDGGTNFHVDQWNVAWFFCN